MPRERIYITEKELNLIASTPPKECWICDELIKNTFTTKDGRRYLRYSQMDDSFIEHLEQIINREAKIEA